MLSLLPTPLVRLGNLFADGQVFAKCEHLALAGSFKIRGAAHLLRRLSQEGSTRLLVVPSMGNTALGAAVGARHFGFSMIGVVPTTISRAKDEKLQALGVELVKVAGGGSALLQTAKELAAQRGAYFVHPHLDPQWTDGYADIAREVFDALPECRSLVVPLGGGGLLMGLTEYLSHHPRRVRLYACEPHNYPTYARYDHARTTTIADGLLLDDPHAQVRQRIDATGVTVPLIHEADIRSAMAGLYARQGLLVEPSSAITVAFVEQHSDKLETPVCVVLTGDNIAREDFFGLIRR